MANQPSPKKKQIGLRVDLELRQKVINEFGRDGDRNESLAFIRALEEATRDVVLSAEDYIAVARELEANKRKARRN